MAPRGKHGNHARGSNHGRWQSQRLISSHGYIKIRVGIEHPLADPNGYAYEHLLVWASAGRRLPETDELLHHIDDDRQNNRLGNLELLKRCDHNALHLQSRERDPKTGRLLPKT